jgi:hypothetical protein
VESFENALVIHRLTGWAWKIFYDPSHVPAAVRETALTRLADRTRSSMSLAAGQTFLTLSAIIERSHVWQAL